MAPGELAPGRQRRFHSVRKDVDHSSRGPLRWELSNGSYPSRRGGDGSFFPYFKGATRLFGSFFLVDTRVVVFGETVGKVTVCLSVSQIGAQGVAAVKLGEFR